MNPAHKENIENRLLKAERWPWKVSGDMAEEFGTEITGRHECRFVIPRDEHQWKKAVSKICDTGRRVEYERTVIAEPQALLDALTTLAVVMPGGETTNDTLAFIAHAPNDIEDLLRDVSRLEEENRALRNRFNITAQRMSEVCQELISLKAEHGHREKVFAQFAKIVEEAGKIVEETKEAQTNG